jgi:hypothetical protein
MEPRCDDEPACDDAGRGRTRAGGQRQAATTVADVSGGLGLCGDGPDADRASFRGIDAEEWSTSDDATAAAGGRR